MSKVLDQLPEEQSPTPVFAILSFVFGLSCLLLISYVFYKFSGPYNVNEGIPVYSKVFVIIYYTLFILGLLCSLFSWWRKERLKWIKGMGIGLNLLVLLFMIFLFLFVQFVES